MNCFEKLFKIKQTTLANKVVINYAESGSNKNHAIILLHGYADSWHSYERVLRYLPDDYMCYALDLRGHGDSSKRECSCIKDFVDDICLFQDSLEIGTSTIIGHSMGSFIGQIFAATHPERTQKLILISSSHKTVGNTVLAEIKNDIDQLQDPVSESFIIEFQTPSLPVPQDFMQSIISESKKIPSRIWKTTFNELLRVDNDDMIVNILAETLVLWGSKDVIFNRDDQVYLTSRVKNSHFIEYEAGHALHWELPELVARDINQFLS